MSETEEILLGLAVIGFILLIACGYYAWNAFRHGVRRVAKADAKVVEHGKIRLNELAQAVGPGLIGANAAFAGITLAALFIVTALIIFKIDRFSEIEQILIYVILGLLAVSTICWLFSLEQLTQMLAPSAAIDDGGRRVVEFYSSSMDLWSVGGILVIIAILLFLLITNVYLAIGVAVITDIIIINYWKIHNGW